VSLLLAPDAQRTGHPSVDLEPERRPIHELSPVAMSPGSPASALPQELLPGAFIVWQRERLPHG